MSRHIKFHQICSVILAFIIGFSIRVIFEFFATLFGPVSLAYSNEFLRQGLPLGIGVVSFAIFQFHPKVKKWILEVIIEIDKVVWPTKKDTFSMTFVVCIILLLSGIVLGLFDLTAGSIMKLIMN